MSFEFWVLNCCAERNFEFWVLSFELSAKPILSCSVLSFELFSSSFVFKFCVQVFVFKFCVQVFVFKFLSFDFESLSFDFPLRFRVHLQLTIQNWIIQNRLADNSKFNIQNSKFFPSRGKKISLSRELFFCFVYGCKVTKCWPLMQ